MNITKDLQNLAKKTSADPIFEELFEQSYSARSNRLMQSISSNKIERSQYNLTLSNQKR